MNVTSLQKAPALQKPSARETVTHKPYRKLSSDEWTSSARSVCAHDYIGLDPTTFEGWLGTFNLCGLPAFDSACNIPTIERTWRHTRIDGLEDYSIFFALSGESTISQNNAFFDFAVGDAMLIDASRPISIVRHPGAVQHHIAVHLPRRQLVSHLGFEPKGGLHRRGTAANRLLLHLISEALQDNLSACALPEDQMQLVFYDLMGALFASNKQKQVSSHTDKLFAQICDMIKKRFNDPELNATTIAAEAGVSLRYLQKLFTMRHMTCGHFISSLRLEHAARLLQRRASLGHKLPLAEIATASGFVDYALFSRKFRARFGYPPSLHANDEVRSRTNQMALSD